ncbi:hypothetical protein GCM10010259_49480 [Streptomyces daghestanicus]|uniref:Uncharacterized protein n=1 Tax=Streptomyces daghestanicus TaxID=66885 RepID=A0ABQ3PZR4_9ACTN|nr:hypothetical protein GCM10010259_49480 [Streptomyces daghestanicus]GHI30511.1 hypothetical protein Sdagh_22410 [Streptomyces daghestanicus]
MYLAGLLTREESYTYLREFFQSPLFREYWDASRAQRATLQQTSEEAMTGRMADALVKELERPTRTSGGWWAPRRPPGPRPIPVPPPARADTGGCPRPYGRPGLSGNPYRSASTKPLT